MGWESALAADVEHMPLMIRTVCGRSAAAAEPCAFTSDFSGTPPSFLVCFLLFGSMFFSPKKEKFKRKRVDALSFLSDGLFSKTKLSNHFL